MQNSSRRSGLAPLRVLAAAAVGTGAYAVYLMACRGPIAPPISLVAPSPLDGVVNTAYSEQFTAAGGSLPYYFALGSAPATMPPGLSLSPAGLLSGTPTAGGTYRPVIAVRDRYNDVKSDTATITIALQITPAALTAATSGSAYSLQLGAIGGTTPYGWLVNAGALPLGLTLSPGGSPIGHTGCVRCI